MKCNGCGNKDAHHVKIQYPGKGGKIEVCEKCGELVNVWNPDVSVPSGGYYDEHLGTYVYSKRQKAALLREKGWVECGDRVNPVLGRPAPYIKDPVKRQKFFRDNYGG